MDIVRILWRSEVTRRAGAWMLVLVIVAVGAGAGSAAIGAARRTASAYPRSLEAGNAPDLVVDVDPSAVDLADVQRSLDAHPDITDRADSGAVAIARIRNGRPDLTYPSNFLASADGRRYYEMDAVTVVEGRMPDRSAATEVVANTTFAEEAGLEVGDELELATLTAEELAVAFEGGPVTPATEGFTVVGIGILPEHVLIDDVAGERLLVGSPAAYERWHSTEFFHRSAITLRPGADEERVRDDVQAMVRDHDLPGGEDQPALFEDRGAITARTQRAVRPYSLGVAAVGVFVLVGTALLASQAVARQIAASAPTAFMLRALGARPRTVARTLATPGLVIVGIGLVLGVVLAAALSPLGPVGPVREVEPSPGFAIDIVAVAIGLGAVGLLVAARTVRSALVVALQAAATAAPARRSRLVEALGRAGASPSTVLGASQAVGSDRRGGGARLAIGSAAGALGLVVAVLALDAGLDHLLATPRLYGNAWDAAVMVEGGYGSVDRERIAADPAVESLTPVAFAVLLVNDREVPTIGMAGTDPGPRPPLVEGRLPSPGAQEIALGRDTLARLDAEVGDTVEVLLPDEEQTMSFEIVGTAVLPALGLADAERPGLGEGALLAVGDTLEPEAIGGALVELRDDGQARAFARRQTDQLGDVEVYADARPADIAGFDELGMLPLALAAAFAVVAIAALAHAVSSAVRGHRRDAAILRALGAPRRVRRTVVRVQALVSVGIAALIGVPLGLVVGRIGWRMLATDTGVVATSPLPLALTAALVAVAAVAAVLIGELTAQRTDRIQTIDALRTE